MLGESDIEQTFPSTTSDWEWRKIKRRPQGTNTARAKRGRWYGLATWPRQRRLTLTVEYRGGAEAWWWITARGRSGAFPGSLALEDVLAQVLNEWNGPEWLPATPGGRRRADRSRPDS